jgi:hypothetical protein
MSNLDTLFAQKRDSNPGGFMAWHPFACRFWQIRPHTFPDKRSISTPEIPEIPQFSIAPSPTSA